MAYSIDRKDRKLAGVASTLGDVFAIDPTFVRIAFVAAFLLISWKLAVIAYVGSGIYLSVRKRRVGRRADRRTLGGDKLEWGTPRRTSVHELRTTLDTNDRRMMAIDHHLARQNDELAREIEALRGE